MTFMGTVMEKRRPTREIFSAVWESSDRLPFRARLEPRSGSVASNLPVRAKRFGRAKWQFQSVEAATKR